MSVSLLVEVTYHVTRPKVVTNSMFPDYVESVMGELLKLEAVIDGLSDSDVGLDMTNDHVRFGVYATAGTEEEAIALGTSCIETAIHAAGGWMVRDTTDHQRHAELLRA